MGLAHHIKHSSGAVLGSDFQLTAYVVFDKLTHKLVVLVLDKIIVSYAAADKNSLYTFNFTYLTENVKIFLMIYLKIFAWLRRKALSALAQTVFQLMCAGGGTEVCGGTAHVVDIALEIGERGEELCFPQNALLASYGNSPALVECYGAEVAVSEAPSVVGDGEFHFLYSGNAALRLVNGVIGAHIGQLVNVVKLGRGKGKGRGQLNEHF